MDTVTRAGAIPTLRPRRLTQFDEAGNAVQKHSQRKAGKGEQHKDKVGRLLALDLQRVKTALLGLVDLSHRLFEVVWIADVEVLAARGWNVIGNGLRSARLQRHADEVDMSAFAARLFDLLQRV